VQIAELLYGAAATSPSVSGQAPATVSAR